MKIFIPDVGTDLTLQSPWSVEIMHEDRNSKFLKVMQSLGDEIELTWAYPEGASYNYLEEMMNVRFPMLFPAGTVLTVDRVYIRKGQSDYSSLSFLVKSCPIPAFTHKKLGGTSTRTQRFFASLKAVNEMEIVDPDE